MLDKPVSPFNEELHGPARTYKVCDRRGYTLQTDALVNNTWVRVIDAVAWLAGVHF